MPSSSAPGRAPVEGKLAIRQFVGESLKVPGFAITWTPMNAEVSGDLGYTTGTNAVTVPQARGRHHDDRRALCHRLEQGDGRQVAMRGRLLELRSGRREVTRPSIAMTGGCRASASRMAALVAALVVGGSGSAPAQSKEPARPFVVEYYYKAKWGSFDEFFRLFKKNHYPVLLKEKELGRIVKVEATRPRLHGTEDGRWDLRVTITWRDAATANDDFDQRSPRRRAVPGQGLVRPGGAAPVRVAARALGRPRAGGAARQVSLAVLGMRIFSSPRLALGFGIFLALRAEHLGAVRSRYEESLDPPPPLSPPPPEKSDEPESDDDDESESEPPDHDEPASPHVMNDAPVSAEEFRRPGCA